MVSANHRRRVTLQIPSLVRQSLGDEVHSVLRQMILQGQLEPGDKVVERRFAQALGVSATPVREALHRLESEGLVETRTGYSTRVALMTAEDLGGMLPVVTVLEGLSARLATLRLNETDLEQLESLVDAMAEHGRQGELQKLVEADAAFHELLLECTENRWLKRVLRDLRAQLERFEYLFFSSSPALRTSVKQHKALVRALRSRAPKAAQEAMVSQWEWGGQVLQAMLRAQEAGGHAASGASSKVLKKVRSSSRARNRSS
jgi:DNA-binding GntR family transcriptional regulator